MTAPAAPRWAVYFAPQLDHPLWRAGCAWLGRDAAVASDRRPAPAQRDEPWRYGFHATLKAPWRMPSGQDEADLDRALSALARRHSAFNMPPLEVSTLADFIALRPAEALPRDHPLWQLADACVVELDPFRAPAPAAEQARRAASATDAAALERLQRWGYPHVLEGWRFHMTLSNSLPPGTQREACLKQARAHFAPALATLPLRCADLCLFKQSAPDDAFVIERRYPLA